jgi:hypothetical protein
MSERQAEANRRNAQLSTGPRTLEGRARVALNALKHGLTSQQVVLPNENPDDFDSFREGLLSALGPHDVLEETLAQMIVMDAWRHRRALVLESALHRRGYQESIVANQERDVRRYETTQMLGLIESGFLDKTEVTDVKAHANANAKLKESSSKLDDPSMEMTRVFQKYLDTFTSLSRYETGLSRSLLRNLHELQRPQAIRTGERVPAPAVVDVDINVIRDGAADLEAILQNKPI